MNIKISTSPGFLTPPAYKTPGSSGLDLACAEIDPIIINPGDRQLVRCGFSMELPPGYEAQIRPRSGLALDYGITVLNTPGTIDSDYRGEVKVILINHGQDPFHLKPGMRIAQMVIAKVERVDSIEITIGGNQLSETSRGAGGFGHTGMGQENGKA